MFTMPKKGFFENKNKYLKRVSDACETQGGLDPINAHYAALFLLRSDSEKLGNYRNGNNPDLVIRACKKLIAESGDVTDFYNIVNTIDDLIPKKASGRK